MILGIYICSPANGLERIFKYTYFIAFRTFYSICKHCKYGRKKKPDLLVVIMLGFCFCGAGAPVQHLVNAEQVLCH